MFERLLPLSYRRRKLRARAPPGPLADLLAAPWPDRASACRDTRFLALDLETTGLDPARDEILSVGFVPVDGLAVQLSGCYHRLVRPRGEIPAQSAVVHRIFDDRSRTGHALEEVVPELLRALVGRVLIAHYARIEVEFLAGACRALYGLAVPLPVVDTMSVEHRRRMHAHNHAEPGALRLAAARARYGLPRYPAHDALTDAIAAAELFLAQVAHGGGRAPLRDYLR